MQDRDKQKQFLIQKIRQTRQGRKIPKLDEFPLEAIQEIYDARVKNFELPPDRFYKWILSKNFYANGANLAIIAYVLNITTERVRQIETKAIKKINHPLIGRKLRKYMEISVHNEI